jgi:hypothetical protein
MQSSQISYIITLKISSNSKCLALLGKIFANAFADELNDLGVEIIISNQDQQIQFKR